MASRYKHFWGLSFMTAIIGVGCSSVPGVAPTAIAGGGGETLLASAPTSPITQALANADHYFITQYHNEKYNPEQTSTNNANCGPTSLAMAITAFGKVPAALSGPNHAFDLIKQVRVAMTGQDDESSWTYPYQVLDAARSYGLQAQMVMGADQIEAAMQVPGRVMVVNINPSPAYADKLVFPYDGGHFALVTAIQGNQVYLNDPLGPAPIVISTQQLETALTTSLGADPNGNAVAAFDGGIMISQ